MQYSVSLNRAHKLVDRLRQHISESAIALRSKAEPIRVRSKQEESANKRVQARRAAFSSELAAYFESSAAMADLRDAIALGNAANGVNSLLAEQNRINQELSFVKELISDADLENSVEWSDVPATPGDQYSSYQLASIDANQADSFAECMRVLKADLHNAADQVSDANRASIQISLSDKLAVIVGLKGV